jgi:hypothetical protein
MHFLVWAAVDYRREHHKLPDRLQNLVPQYFAWVPIDPWNGRDFVYEPKGIPLRMKAMFQELGRDQPFAASAGEQDCRIEINPQPNASGAPPIRILIGTGRNPNNNPQEPIEFPSPTVAIPSEYPPSTPPGKHPSATSERTPAKLFGQPAPKRPTKR